MDMDATVSDSATRAAKNEGDSQEALIEQLRRDLKSAEKELEILKELDVKVVAGTQGGTDHLSFAAEGVPGFAFHQDPAEYYLTHHTQSDTLDKARWPDLVQGAQVMSLTAMRVANLPDLLPRKQAKPAAPAPSPMPPAEAKPSVPSPSTTAPATGTGRKRKK